MTKEKNITTGRVTVDNARIDRLKEQYISTPQEIDHERTVIMHDTYEDTAGYHQIIRRSKFFAHLLERKTIYIDDNLFVGSMAGSVNGIYTYPEWNVQWMKDEGTVEKSKTPREREANEWALEYWGKWALRPRADEAFITKYGFDPDPIYKSGLVTEFLSWPGGGGNLNYPKVYNEGLSSMIKDVEERQMALEFRLPDAQKFYFYEACKITMKAVIRYVSPVCRAGPGDGCKGEKRNPQGGADCHRRDLRMGARASCQEPAGSHPKPLHLSHRSRNRAGGLRLFGGPTGSEPGSVFSA